jgi:hypothetical protein
MSANAPQAAPDARLALPDFLELEEFFLDYYEHRFDYAIEVQKDLREDLNLESAPAAQRTEATRRLGGPAWLGAGA